ncbi:MAG: hypothetical protein ACJAUL_002697 [Paraglaciecola sp.]|jgi:uncharacterized protein YqcC (DUF446 family)
MQQRMPRSALEVQTKTLLIELEKSLKTTNLWSTEFASDWAMASTAPFACDRLYFEQWLQFIFIPTLNDFLEQGRDLPNKIALLPMAQERCKTEQRLTEVMAIIARFDHLFCGVRD